MRPTPSPAGSRRFTGRAAPGNAPFAVLARTFAHMPRRARQADHKLAAILAADVAGYSRLMSVNQSETFQRLVERREVMDGLISQHRGCIANTAGDSVLAEFPSVIDAVRCALQIQGALARAKRETPPRPMRPVPHGRPRRRRHRAIGGFAGRRREHRGPDPGPRRARGLCISEFALEHVRKALPISVTDLGLQMVRNIPEPIRAFAIHSSGGPLRPAARLRPARRSRRRFPTIRRSRSCPSPTWAATPSRSSSPTASPRTSSPPSSRLRWLFVIARNSTFVYKGKAVDVRRGRPRPRRALRARGQRQGRRPAHPHHRPAHRRRDRQAHLGREIRPRAATTSSPSRTRSPSTSSPPWSRTSTPRKASAPRASRRTASTPGACRPRHRPDQQGGPQAERGGAGAPARSDRRSSRDTRRAHAILGWAVWWAAHCYWIADTRRRIQAGRRARAELALRPRLRASRGRGWFSASASARRAATTGRWASSEAALNLNPSFALGRMGYGWALLRAGRFDEAIAETGKALRMSPMDSFAGLYTTIHGLALLGARRFAEALPFCAPRSRPSRSTPVTTTP